MMEKIKRNGMGMEKGSNKLTISRKKRRNNLLKAWRKAIWKYLKISLIKTLKLEINTRIFNNWKYTTR